MAGRDQQVTAYIDADLRKELETRAEKENMSVSRLVAEVLEAYVENDLVAMTSRQTEAEERIEELVAEATGEITETTETALEEIRAHHELLQLVMLRTGMYSAGNWEVLKQEYGEIEVKQAMQSASQRFQDDAAELGIDINAIGTDKPVRRNPHNEHSSSGRSAETPADDDGGDGGDQEDDDGWSY